MQAPDNKPASSKLNWEKLGFIALALVFWFLIKLSKEGYTYTATVELEYHNLPNDQVLVSPPASQLQVEIGGTGFAVFRSWMRGNLSWSVDYSTLTLAKTNQVEVWNPSINLNAYRDFLPQGLHVVAIGTDSIGFAFNAKSRKKVAVVTADKLVFAPGFGLEAPIELQPDSVWITGPKDLLDTLSRCTALGLPAGVHSGSVQGILKLKLPHPALGLSQDQVAFKAEVVPYTELKLKVPVEVENLPEGVAVALPDSLVELHCILPLNQISSLSSGEFRVAVSYAEIEALGFPEVVPVHIRTFPERIKRVWLNQPYQPIVIRNL